MKISLWNNTDFQHTTTFSDLDDLRSFIEQYYKGEEGNLYTEQWSVEGEYPDELFEILDCEETGWQPKGLRK